MKTAHEVNNISEYIDRMESINLQLEYIEAALKVYASGFEDKAMLSKVSSLEISNTLFCVYEMLKDQRNALESLIGSMIRSESHKQSDLDS